MMRARPATQPVYLSVNEPMVAVPLELFAAFLWQHPCSLLRADAYYPEASTHAVVLHKLQGTRVVHSDMCCAQ